MQFTKPALNIDKQVQRLQARGMLGDPSLIAQRLAMVSYYRLTAYWHPFRQSDESFKPNTSFDVVWNRYVFDRHLRLMVMDAIERIEITIRSQLALHHGMAHGPFAYFENNNSLPDLNDQQRKRFKSELKQQFNKSTEIFIEHFKERYGEQHDLPPVWMATEIMTFGCMLTLYRGCDTNVKRQVAKIFGIHHSVLKSWLLSLNLVRNICAHHGRLWNRQFGIMPSIPRNDQQWHTPIAVQSHRVFGVLTICKYCLNRIAPQSHWPLRLKNLLEKYPEPPKLEMGFPDHWLSCPIWSSLQTNERTNERTQ